VQFLRDFPALGARLLAKCDRMALVVGGMSIIYRKPAAPHASHHVLSDTIRNL
jgi:hypothetical protein